MSEYVLLCWLVSEYVLLYWLGWQSLPGVRGDDGRSVAVGVAT